MRAAISALQLGRLKLFLRVVAISAALGAVYGALLRAGGSVAVSILAGVLNGGAIAAAIGGIEIGRASCRERV